ncbi:MAG: NUDIX hydrolase [Candidatus Altimarinota bacterium]
MTLDQLILSLREHTHAFPEDGDATAKVIVWIEKYRELAFTRENLEGHITGSLFIVNENHTKVLLMFHHKLQKWLQFGGHADGEIDVLSVAIREFQEESGIQEEPRIIGEICDIDIHTIPARHSEPEHLHFDILFLASISESVSMQKEVGKVEDLKWVDISDIEDYSTEEKVLRVIQKLRNL